MEQHEDAGGSRDAALLALARQLTDAAAAAGRADVAAKAEEAISLVDANAPASAGSNDTVLRILNGLGL